MRRVVITGAGTINPLGYAVGATHAAMRQGHCAIGPLDIPDLDRLQIQIGAQVRDYDPTDHFTKSQLSLYDRFTQFALIAADQALRQAGQAVVDPDRAGVVMGTSGGGLTTQDDSYRAVYQDGKDRVHPFVVPRLMANAAASHMSMTHGLRGPNFTISTACASSNHAMGQALAVIRSGQADVMLTGGAEAMLCFGGIKAWEGLRVMARDTCRPFSADRTGMVQGEGAAVFVFEEREKALARGAHILAEVAGFSATSDAGDIVSPDCDGAVRAMCGALRDAGLTPADIGYINAHGTGTAMNDRTECAAVRKVFGVSADDVLISSTKSMHGHLIGAAGAVELLACLLALNDGIIAPTVNHRIADPDCALDIVANTARTAKVDAVLSNAFAFGGLNAVLALTRA
ncbi:beta-ketoacyl-[acyl-carrier-protein] synthase family protein [Loktanella sp. SALINAS62]|uniref:beta-ketoacyl-[acyl-carrier-protein] synthase family protein n=1 Tax=Loktanella sp. SALINAS62 TaxID=2706124 RepID=UPI001B8B4689|nr:beta-ketoacyl-[acyl-carrier-protein] synthase family protein [Loktanella sp. SALINAS62]MBS1303669.1 beta-ketoacyl-[acyl-carrier-protein] synthase family protein [Loktanella sp. SALINAS62]